jgi:dTDP-4-dehydrorhamnose reductase
LKILITGAHGMLGSSLCRFYQNNHDVYAFHRDSECYAVCSADFSLDLIDVTQLQTFFNQLKPDLVIHCAGMTSVDKCEEEPLIAKEANVYVTENIAHVCSNETKLVYISTDQVYGKADDRSETNTVLQPLNQYGKTKLQGELKVQELCTNNIIVRTNIFGWNVKPGRVSSAEWIYHSLKNGKEITLFTDYTFTPLYTEFLADIIMQLINVDFNGVINIGSPTSCSKYDFGMKLAEAFGFNQSLIRKGSIQDHPLKTPRPDNLDLNVLKLYDIDLSSPDYEESLDKFNRDKP